MEERDVARFWSKVDVGRPSECWPWKAALSPDGYGVFNIRIEDGFRARRAHRVAYELHFETIPEGWEVDHVAARGCQRRDCVNPDHLEAVTKAENLRRAAPDACLRGHPLTGPDADVHVRPDGSRLCRRCDRIRSVGKRQREQLRNSRRAAHS